MCNVLFGDCYYNRDLLIGGFPLKEASEQGSLLVISMIYVAYLYWH